MMHSRYGRVVARCCLLVLPLVIGGAATAQGGDRMIADFEGAKVETVTGLALPVLADEQLGGNSTAQLTLIHPGAHASKGALRISFKVEDGFAAPFSAVVALLGDEGLATDLSAYRGVRFYARSRAGAFNADVARFAGRAIRYSTPLEVKAEWTLVELPFEKFIGGAPPDKPGPLAPKDVISVGFSLAPPQRGQFDLEVDQVEIYK